MRALSLNGSRLNGSRLNGSRLSGSRLSGLGLSVLVGLLSACAPDFGRFQVVEGAVTPAGDGGMLVEATPELGAPCGRPYLAVATPLLGASTEGGQVRRYTLPALEPCRETPLGREHAAFGTSVTTVTVLPDGTEVVGVEDALLALDADGFPRWRAEVDHAAGFRPVQLFTLDLAGTPYLVAPFYDDRASSSLSGVRLFDLDGLPAGEVSDGLFGRRAIAPDPSGGVLLGRYSALERSPLDLDSTRFAEDDEVLPRMEGVGPLVHLDTDLVSGRVALVYDEAVAQLERGPDTLVGPVRCEAHCSGFLAATPDPESSDGVLAVCESPEDGRVRHLVRLSFTGACELAVDGTFLGDHALADLAVVGG